MKKLRKSREKKHCTGCAKLSFHRVVGRTHRSSYQEWCSIVNCFLTAQICIFQCFWFSLFWFHVSGFHFSGFMFLVFTFDSHCCSRVVVSGEFLAETIINYGTRWGFLLNRTSSPFKKVHNDPGILLIKVQCEGFSWFHSSEGATQRLEIF